GAEQLVTVVPDPGTGGPGALGDVVEGPGSPVAERSAHGTDELADGAALAAGADPGRDLEGDEAHPGRSAPEQRGRVEVGVAPAGAEVEPRPGHAEGLALGHPL